MIRTIILAAALALVVTLPAVPANAQSIRTFVSTTGSDSNPCSITAPCRHFSAAVAVTSAGGEVDALDAGAYGSFTISQAITIDGQGWSYVAPPNGGNGITINAVSGNVTLSGISLNGVGTTGTNGIVFNSGSSLTVTNCVVQNFPNDGGPDFTTGDGILMQPTSGAISFLIANTILSNNGFAGFIYLPPSGSATANGVIDHVIANNNRNGISFDTISGGGSTTVAISNSIASDNAVDGIGAENDASPLAVSIDNSSANSNTTGFSAGGTPKVSLGRSVATSNVTGIVNGTSPNTFYSYQDNRINGNGTDVTGSLNSYALK
jgi:hypothetical protein